jgi:outer membrane protein assembly factor BamA
MRLVGEAESGSDIQHALAGWIRYGATVKGYVDLNDHARILSLTLGLLFADPLGSEQIPFTELVSLGGDKWMHGYFDGRLLGRSAAVSSLEYAWPIGPRLGGVLQTAMGNVFNEHLSGFDFGLMRLSWALGLSLGFDPPVQLVLGFGTSTFDQGTRVDSVRFSFGVPKSF